MGLTKAILLAVLHIESGFNPAAHSPAGAKGLAQLTSIGEAEVCAQYGCEDGYDIWHPQTNVDMGAKLLRFYLEEANGDIYGAIVLYNSGYLGYAKYRRGEAIPAETQAYLTNFKRLRKFYATLLYRLPEELPRYYDLVDGAADDNLFDSTSLLVGPPRY